MYKYTKRRKRNSETNLLQMNKSVEDLLSFVVFMCFVSTTSAFVFGSHCSPRLLKRPHLCSFAKPPPTANFDLEAIEAFERQLDRPAVSSSTPQDDDSLQDNDNIDVSAANAAVSTHTVPQELHNKRLDAVIAALEPNLSRSQCGTLVTNGNVQIQNEDGNYQVMDRKSFKVEAGTVLQIQHVVQDTPTEIIPENIPLDILFEDEHMIVLNKAADMVVHPAAGNWEGTVVNALAYYLANTSPYGSGDFVGENGSLEPSDEVELNDIAVEGTDGEAVSFRPGIVHRLDKGTTGVLVVAKTRRALAALSEAFASRNVKKTYVTITVGNPGRRVVIDKPIGRHPVHRQRMRVVPDPHRKNSSGMAPKDRMISTGAPTSQTGRRALSFVDTLAFDGKLSVVQVRIETGRTHQIRVHLQDRHTPVYGDDVYGLTDWNKRLSKSHQISRPLLHAQRLELQHPITGKEMVFCAPMAPDMLRIAKTIWPQGEEERPDLFTVSTIEEKYEV